MAQAEVLPRTQRPPGRVADPCIMVIFGAAGDLTRRKLIPALYNLAKVDLLSRDFAILGIPQKAVRRYPQLRWQGD
jgi:glucose-6-phosphate 1-dehydrogenase